MTTSPGAVQTQKQKSPLPIILGVLVVLVLGSGCVLGGFLWWSADAEGASIDDMVAGIFGEETSESSESTPTTTEDIATPDEPKTAANEEAADPPESPGEEAPGNEEIAANSGDDNSAGADSAVLALNTAGDKPAAGEDKAGENSNQHESESVKSVKKDSRSVEIHAKKVELVEKTVKKPKIEPEAEPPRPAGNIRQSKLSAAGDACLEPDVEEVLKAARGKFLSCYSDLLKSNPDAAGEVMLAWNITPQGDLLRPEVPVSDLDALNGCLLSKLKRLRFEPTIGGRCYVRATYHFSP